MAGTRTLQVEIIGDASQLERTLGRAGQTTKDFGKEAEHSGGLIHKLGESWKEVGKNMLAVGGGMFAAEGVIEGFKKSFEAGENLTKSQEALDDAIKTTGGNVEELRASYDMIAKKAADYGISQDTATRALARATLFTGDATEAQHAFEEAVDISAATHKSFAAVLTATSKAQEGNTGALARYGVLLGKNATSAEQYNLVMSRFKGQAEDNTTATDVLRAHLDNMQAELGQKLVPAVNAVIEFVSRNWPTISAVVTTVANAVGVVITNVVVPAITQMSTIIKAIVGWVKEHWPEIKAVIETTMNAVRAVIETVLNTIRAFWNTWGGLITTLVKGVFNQVKIEINTVVTVIRGVIEVIDGLIHGRWSQVWNGLKTIVGGVFNGIIATIKNLVGTVLTAAGQFGNAIFRGITGALSGIGQKIAELVVYPINKLIAGLNAVHFGVHIPGINTHIPGVGKIGGVDLDIDPFPYISPIALASGGIVTSPTLALIGEAGPEAVVPLNGRGVGDTYHFHFPNYVGNRNELISTIRAELYRIKGRNGSLQFT